MGKSYLESVRKRIHVSLIASILTLMRTRGGVGKATLHNVFLEFFRE